MPLDRLRTMTPLRAALTLLFGAALLSLPFMPTWDAARARIAFEPRFELEIVLLVAAMALLGLRGRSLGAGLRRGIASALALAAILHLGSVFVAAAFERELDLFWDIPELPSLLGRLVAGSGWLLLAGLILGGIGLAIANSLAIAEMGRAIDCIARPRAVLALSCVGLLLAVFGGAAYVPARASGEVARQAGLAWRSLALLRGDELPAAPPASDLGKLKHRDLYLVLLDSYGAGMLEDAQVAAALEDLEGAADDAGYYLLSGRLAAPGTDAGARLSEASLASGLRLDPLRYRRLLASGGRSLANYLAAAGYGTVDVAPDLRRSSFEEGAWGFERTIAAADLGPAGATARGTLVEVLARFDAKPHPPLFVRVEIGGERAPAETSPEAVASDLKALGEFITHLKGQALVIVVGNRVAGAETEVPIHVLSRDEELVLPFATLGYSAGAEPPSGGAAKGVESFLPDFLRLFASGTSVASIL
ncbi:MAG TPA: hypothetical protein VEC75_13780 [Stellaceae bacterium]|nr:hypothetical protein [Stellaceae bacterium]